MSVLSPAVVPDSARGAGPPQVTGRFSGDGDDFRVLLRRYRLGLALSVSAILMLFIGFSSAYVVRRGIPTYDPGTGAYSAAWEPLVLPIGLLAINSLILVGASVTMEMARRTVRIVGRKPASIWINVSLLLSVGFIAGQGIAWGLMRSRGGFLSSGASTAFFYVITGTHALHALVGVLALGWIAIRHTTWVAWRRYLAVDLTAWYLHSMTVLWIYLFCFLLFV